MILFSKFFLPALLLILGAFVASATDSAFQHPSIMSNQVGLNGLKSRVKSDPAAKLGYAQLKQSKYAALSRPHTPYAIVHTVASAGNKYETAFRGDAQAAHATALMWVISGDKKYRDKAIAILDDWSAKFEKLDSDKSSSHQVWLEAAWAVPIWIAAADIIRYYNKGEAGWPPEKIAAFDRYLNILVKTARKAKDADNNWGTSATLAIMAAAVYQNDRPAYDESLALHKRHLASISKKDGALGPDYLRDPWHPQYTICTWIQTCEIAWNQGDDLYGLKLDGQSEPRLALCLEHFAKLFIGQLSNPAGLKKGDYKNAHLGRQGYEIAFNHYLGREDLSAALPTFAKIVPDWRPGGIDNHFLAWDCLTHGGLAKDEESHLVKSAQQTYYSWTNAEGDTIRAGFRGLHDGQVKLILSNGRLYDYSLDELDAASQALAKRLAK